MRARCDAEGVTSLHAELARRDPAMAARLRPGELLISDRLLQRAELFDLLAEWRPVLTPQPKRPGLFELKRSIRFFGPLPRPQRALVARVEPAAGAACEASAS